MANTVYDIFISYRRVDSHGAISGRDVARIIKLELGKRPTNEAIHYNVFFDHSEITDGDFEMKILPAIEFSKVFILVLSKDALTRCSNEGDWVRREILTAIRTNSKIIPVVIDNEFTGWPSDLPEELIPLTKIELSYLSMGMNFESDMDKIERERIKVAIPHTDQLSNYTRKGFEVLAEELYFDKERARSKNGFFPNKYFPRASVDGQLAKALMEQRKYIILLGVPGSGKTRAMYQLLANPQEIGQSEKSLYALGELSKKDVVILNQDNVTDILHLLEWELNNINAGSKEHEIILLCDQLKDVFRMLQNDDVFFSFFDILSKLPHVQMIATSIPSAFNSLCERWKEYGRRPLEDDQLTAKIVIPQISQDPENVNFRNWIQNEFQANTFAESIGDYIPRLNSYKQAIVKRLYLKIADLPCLATLLSAMQIVETYRHETPLFLPVMIARMNWNHTGKSTNDFIKEIVNTLNYLISNNVIKVTSPDKGVLVRMYENMFQLNYDLDDEEEFIFDGETFPETPLSTSYSYGVNEIVWNYLEQEDANKHIRGEETLLKDFQNVKDVVRAAKEYYVAVHKVSTLRRILPRIPRTDCYYDASEKLWEYVYKEFQKSDMYIDDQEEFIVAVGMLIGRSRNISQVKDSIKILEKKGITPDYNIIGELYSVGYRLDNDNKKEIASLIDFIRSNYGLVDDSFFSLTRRIVFEGLDFNSAICLVKDTKYIIGETLQDVGNILINNKKEMFSIRQMFGVVGQKAESINQWIDLFELYNWAKITISRKALRNFFAVVADEQYRHESDINLLREYLQNIFEKYPSCIATEDEESAYFYSIEKTQNFKQALIIYKDYRYRFNRDNQRLISIALRTLRDNEFQSALNFLIEVNESMKKNDEALSVICYNNLIKMAPNVSEALSVIPFMPYLQENTIANILQVVKKRRIIDENSKTGKKEDPKRFFYAYEVVMQGGFYEFRSSPYVIGLLYDLATTPKQEKFIRDIFLNGVFLQDIEEVKKCELIDYSTAIASIRIQKNYRSIDEIWSIFNTCRKHYSDQMLYVNSEIYSNMMRKIFYLCKNDKTLLDSQMRKMYEVIKNDGNRIIRDESYYSSLYRYIPEKQVVNDKGNITEKFKKDFQESNILHIRPLNNIMASLKPLGFDVVWNFYEYIVDYYKKHGRWSSLRPEIRTITYLMETVQNEDQLIKVEEAVKKWVSESTANNSRVFQDAYKHALEVSGLIGNVMSDKCDTTIVSTKVEDIDIEEYLNNKRNYKEETNYIINMAQKDIYLYGSLSASQLNKYLIRLCAIKDDIYKDTNMRNEVVRKCTKGLYWNVFDNLIDAQEDYICLDAESYISLLKLSCDDKEAGFWIDKLIDLKDHCKYSFVTCRQMATSVDVARYDIDLSLDFFEFWEKIMDDIGYDPSDADSFTCMTQKEKYGTITDYDNYWSTRREHLIREMKHYSKKISYGVVDKAALKFVKEQMLLFEKYNVEFPVLKGSSLNFKDEISILS